MEAIENIKDIFSIFHDGGIEGWEGDDKLLTLTIGCTYLAERINPQFNVFYLELTGVKKLELHPWTLPVIDNTPAPTRPEDIFKGDIEITSCEVVNEVAVIYLYQHDTDLAYTGGTLHLKALDIKIFCEDRKAISIAELADICSAYWKQFNTTD